MEIQYLKTFIAIADSGTFGAAGRIVGLTQSAVSQQIRVLENTLEVKLFDRSVRPPALTVQGLTLLEGARKIVKEYEVVFRTTKGEKLSGNLVLGAIKTSFTGALAKALFNLREQYPQLQIHAKTMDASELVAMVASERLDAAIIPGGSPLTGNITWWPFDAEPMVVISSRDIRGKTDREVLEQYPFINFSRNVPSALLIDKEIHRRDIKIQVAMEIDSYAAITHMVSHGLGVSVIPDQEKWGTLPDNICKIPYGRPPIKRLLGTILAKDSPKKRIVSALHSELCDLSGYTKKNS